MKFCYHLFKILSNWIFEFNVEYVFNETKLDALMSFSNLLCETTHENHEATLGM